MQSNGYKIKTVSGMQFRAEKVEIEKDVILIKTARDYESNPYIPASAMKGKLRFSLLACHRYMPQNLINEVKKVFKLNLLNPKERDIFIDIIFGFSDKSRLKNKKIANNYQNCKVIILDGRLVISSVHNQQLIEQKIEAYQFGDERHVQLINERINRGLLFFQEIIIQNFYIQEQELISRILDCTFEYIANYGYLGANGSKGYGRVSILKCENNEI